MVGFTKESRTLEAKKKQALACSKTKALKRKEAEEQYLLAPIKCGNLNCVKFLSYLQFKGKVRFCCRACSNSAIPRISSEISREKVSKSLIRPARKYFCLTCKVELETRRKYCSKPTCNFKHRSIAAKKARQTSKQNGTFVGWRKRTVKPSYPEMYFIHVLKNEKLWFKREKRVGKWFIDFALLDYNIALEIDGNQHTLPDRMASDKEKDKFLAENGWKVFRIRWFNPINEKSKLKLYSQIEEFKKFVNKVKN